MNNQELEAFEHAMNSGFLIGGIVFIVVIGILWFSVLRKKAKQVYPIPQMLGIALVAQGIGLFAFFS